MESRRVQWLKAAPVSTDPDRREAGTTAADRLAPGKVDRGKAAREWQVAGQREVEPAEAHRVEADHREVERGAPASPGPIKAADRQVVIRGPCRLVAVDKPADRPVALRAAHREALRVIPARAGVERHP